MACVNPDGTLTPTARQMLRALERPMTPEEAASAIDQPLFKVRSNLRLLVSGGLVSQTEETYVATAAGREKAAETAGA